MRSAAWVALAVLLNGVQMITSAPTNATEASAIGDLVSYNGSLWADRKPVMESTVTGTVTGGESTQESHQPSVTSRSATSATATTSSNSTLVVALAVVGTTFVLVMGAVGYRIIGRRKHDPTTIDEIDNYEGMLSPTAIDWDMPKPVEPQVLPVPALENDEGLWNYRIDGSAIHFGDIVVENKSSVVYRGVYAGETVTIKQLQPEAWTSERRVDQFISEIQNHVRLHHAKIVTCVGISWTSAQDLSLLTEYMAGGTLGSLLQSQSGEPTGREWTSPWTASQIQSKAAIATDVADALVYLHSLERKASSIYHRDLRADHVLLDLAGRAKLQRVHATESLDKLIAHEVGAVAWIAPEVLKGERATDASDIYSFGVLLIELDRCRHPFADEAVLLEPKPTRRKATRPAVMRNTRIAIHVTTGKLKPTPTPSCPPQIQNLITQCVALDAADRPTAQQIYEAFRVMK